MKLLFQVMKISNVAHVFFDLDHTLWDFEKNSALTFKKIFNQAIKPMTESTNVE